VAWLLPLLFSSSQFHLSSHSDLPFNHLLLPPFIMAALDLGSLKDYVRGGASRALTVGTIAMDITHNLLQSRFVEIMFEITNSVRAVKDKIYGMTGSNPDYMRLFLNGNIEMREEDNKLLGEYGAKSGDFVHCVDEDPFSSARGGAMDDVSQVKKFELTEEEYDKRDNTYRAYKKKQLALDPNWKSIYQVNSEKKLAAAKEARRAAGYPDEKYEAPSSIRGRIQVGQRCIVEPGARRGEVKYVGVVPEIPNYEVANDGTMPAATPEQMPELESAAAPTPDAAASPTDAPHTAANDELKPTVPIVGECLWIGVQLDEPVGKHDGMIKGKRYFNANHHAGIFAKPSAVKTGDYPEVDPFDSDEEENKEQSQSTASSAQPDIYEEL
jgi:tubulin-folding cofactor B